MVNNCQIPTPKEYVSQMLKYAKYKENVFGKRVLENSCGEGNILIEIVKIYIKDARRKKISEDKILDGMERDIVAYEIDNSKIKLCRIKLDKIARKMGFEHVKWNIQNKDFLKQPIEKYDYIIGNPPYITYHDLSESDRLHLKENFLSCEEGRFDYSYAFIEASIKSLEKNGKLIYLVPYSVIKNKFANKLREYMASFITGIYDYTGIKVFPDAITSSVILLMENKQNKKNFEYHGMLNKSKRRIPCANLKGKWKFVDEEGIGEERFGDYFDVCNSVATLFNKAYVIESFNLRGNYYYVNGKPIEKQIVFPAISTKSHNKTKKNADNTTVIIFPYKVENGMVDHYLKNDFEKKFPNATNYLKTYITELNNRKSDKNALWFEYGRSQAINRVFGKKLVIPMVITNNVSVCQASENMIPYAGYFVKCAKNSIMTLDQAKQILESKEFYDYIKTYGTPTTPTSYRISVDDIKEYRF
ncbi:MAG: Eco57I restriction-modification methylase domain-containing protein [Lachnospiraceae bacterium]|nr:Eco57I restriction-modification methylase domain-containing protein [Lachnospiraceae bacterium]